jgi:hypothetical protein
MLHSNLDKAILNQLQAAVPKVYISTILDPIIRIGNTTCLQLLTHLHATYGHITEAVLEKSLERMKNQWNPPMSIEILFTKINYGVVFATAGRDTSTLTPHPDNTDKVDAAAITQVQEIIGIFIFYG